MTPEGQEWIKIDTDIWIAIVTTALALFTYRLVTATQGLVTATQDLFKEAKESSARQLGVNTWMHFIEKWDSGVMRKSRRENASQIRSHQVRTGTDPILDFFEQVGTVYRLNWIDKDLVYSSLSYDAENWWTQLKAYVYETRKQMGDPKVYDEFEAMVAIIRNNHPEDPEVNLRTRKRFI